MNLGDTLRQAREHRQIALIEISHATNIPCRILEAIDRGDLTTLPGGVFTRAYLRAYAAQVGLEPDAVLAEYGVKAAGGVDEDLSALRSRLANRGLGQTRWKAWVVAAALALAGGTLYVSVFQATDDRQVVEATDSSTHRPSEP